MGIVGSHIKTKRIFNMARNVIGLKHCCPSIENLNKLVIIMKICSKPIPPLSGLIGLVTGCITDGVTGTLLLVPIFTYTKLGGLY